MASIADGPAPRRPSDERLARTSSPADGTASTWRVDARHPTVWPHLDRPASGVGADQPGPAARELAARFPELSNVALVMAMLGVMVTGAIWFQTDSQPWPETPATRSTLAPGVEAKSRAELLLDIDDARREVRQAALVEFGRRGAIDTLDDLRRHPQLDVRAGVPWAVVHGGRDSHRHIPWLAEGLTSNDAEVRRNTASALRRLVDLYGPYHEDSLPVAAATRRMP